MKEKTRRKIKEKRRKQTKEENKQKSKEIKERLFELDEYKDAKTVLFYVSNNDEVFTHDMIRESFYKKNVIIPISNTENNILILSKLKSWDELTIGSYRILEPKKEKIRKTNINEIDLIIVPGVAFDAKGNRMGHGKGYYDRLLENKKQIPTVGLAFEFQVVNDIPTDEYDIPVDLIITEKRIIVCSNKL
jgi:5-formyltetrahydrofolate cyclo-ligase